jgi:hypothetical protein
VAGTVGVRLVLVHAKDEEAKSFYRHYGFVESPVDPMTLMMPQPRRLSQYASPGGRREARADMGLRPNHSAGALRSGR